MSVKDVFSDGEEGGEETTGQEMNEAHRPSDDVQRDKRTGGHSRAHGQQ
jgi:hypothetical protein